MSFWRLVKSGPGEPYWNMAVDQALYQLCQEEKNFPPTLRLYSWRHPAITVGYFQRPQDFLNLEKIEREGIRIVRRMTGGKAILHSGELTYCLVANSSSNPELGATLTETYRRISSAWVDALEGLGIRVEYKRGKSRQVKSRSSCAEACFQSLSAFEITADAKKILGSAQRRSKGIFIQQGSLPVARARESILGYLLPQGGKPDRKENEEEKATSLESLLQRQVGLEELKDKVKSSFEKYFGITLLEEALSQKETKLAYRLELERYSQPAWNLACPVTAKETGADLEPTPLRAG